MYKKAVIVVILVLIVVSLVGLVLVSSERRSASGEGKIALIYVDGVIMGGRGQTSVFGETGGTDALMKELREARDDESIRAVVLRINSPGGSAPASQEVGEEIKRLRQSGKPVVTSMGDVAASGGYWLAAVTDKIYANPATLTGSIGVYIPYTNWEELFKKIGVHSEKIKSGPYKDILSPDRSLTAEERAIIQTMVDDLYEQFITVVAEGRHLDKETVRKLADGRIYTGNQAKAAGLVDELGNLYDALDAARQLAGIHGKASIKEFGRGNPWSTLFSSQLNWQQNLLRQVEGTFTPLAISPLRQVE
ncbi:Clp protease ClpP [Anaerosporomusa subterranea]|uniref:Clp protease ClpP n=1 Tax=Anaerosporomusa subterranea TaxID=1794912 RepID=A0A154BWR6_ANASB|nr:signal peptide peptidase SppA [Anaerosporomusa subterranea]KYZ78240.1 Clp protease ClpP [Anaerosporomusa subterranea]